MRVILVNGSPHEKGCTYVGLKEMQQQFEKNGIKADIFWIGKDPISDSLVNVINDNNKKVDEFLSLAKECDGFVFGGPTYFANANGNLISFMNRVFYGTDPNLYKGKVACGITAARRAGTLTSLDEIHHYFYLKQMIIPTALYWNQVFGAIPTDAILDKEGLQNLRKLANNMSYIMKLIKIGKENGIEFPELEEKRERTNFIH